MKTYKFLTWSFVLASLLTSCGSDSGNGGGGTSLPNIEETKKDTATNGSASSDTTSPATASAASAAPTATPANIKEAVTAITSATVTVAAELKTLVKNTSIKINSGDTLVSTTAVNLMLAAENAAQQYVTNVAGCASGGTWENFNATKLWTLGQTNVTATVYVKFRDNANVESDCVSTTITHDSIAPTGSFDILTFCDSQEGAMRGCDNTARIRTYLAGPAVYNRYDTNTLHVVLSISAPDATQMYVTNTAGCTTDGSWETYATTRNWVLTQTNAVNNVYIKFKDTVGNQSSCTTASIIHSDTAVPYSGYVSFNSYTAPDTTTTTPIVDLWLRIADGSWLANDTAKANGFIADETYVKITNNNNCSGGSWQSYTITNFTAGGNAAWYKFPAYNVGVGSGTAWVSAQFKDVSGNVSACFSRSITVAP